MQYKERLYQDEFITHYMACELLSLQQGDTVWVPEFQRNATVTVIILCHNCDSNRAALVAVAHAYYHFTVILKIYNESTTIIQGFYQDSR